MSGFYKRFLPYLLFLISTASYAHDSLDNMKENQYVIGIDLGGTKIEMGLIGQGGKILASKNFPTQELPSLDALLRKITLVIQEFEESSMGDVLAVGIGVCGQVDKKNGSVIFAPQLGWKNIPLQNSLSAMTSLPVFVLNDVRAAALGEWQYGAGRNCDDLVCLFVGTGLGSGIISSGHLLQGAANSVGELGHTTIIQNGTLCKCGNRGCLETVASGSAVAKKAKEKILNEPLSGLTILEKAGWQINAITTKHVVEAYLENDPLATLLIEEMTEGLITGCINAVHTFNPERLILGGGVIRDLPDITEEIQTAIQLRALESASAPLKVVRAELDGNAGVIGAAIFAWTKCPINKED